MARPPRVEYNGAVYYVTAEGSRGRDVFGREEDKTAFLKVLSETETACGLVIYAQKLEDNRYHLLIETPLGNLVRAMTRIQVSYSMRHNSSHNMSGCVFGDRYRSYLVDKHNYLTRVRSYVSLAGNKGKDKLLKGAYGGFILGDEKFVEWVKKTNGRTLNTDKTPVGISKEDILRRVKKGFPGDKKCQRIVAICLLRKYTDMSLKEIAAEFGGMHCSNVTHIVKKNCAEVEADERVTYIVKQLDALRARRQKPDFKT